MTAPQTSVTSPSYFSDENTELATQFQMSLSTITAIRNKVAKDATYDEFLMLLHQSKKYNLDPLMGEIWCIKYSKNGPAAIFASKSGIIKNAHRTGDFDGIESGLVEEEIERSDGKKKKAIKYAWAKVWRKGCSHPFCAEVDFEEFSNPNNRQWGVMPRYMIRNTAEKHALLLAFPMEGISYDSSEEPPDESEPTTSEAKNQSAGSRACGQIIDAEVRAVMDKNKEPDAPPKPAKPIAPAMNAEDFK